MKSSLQHNYYIILFVIGVCARTLFAQVPSVATLGPNGGIATVVRGTANDSIILIGTRSSGVYRSLNGGASWAQTTLIGSAVNDIVFHPTDVRIVFAATNDGLYQSADAGLSWSPTLLNTPISSLAIYPINPKIMFAGDGRPKAQSKGILKTTDGGTNWTQVVSGLAGNFTITSLAIDSSSLPTGFAVFAGTEDAGVYRTSDAGNNWSVFLNNTGLPGGPGLRIHSLSITPNIVLTAGTSLGQFFWIGGPQWFQYPIGIADSVAQSSAIVVGPGQKDTVSFYMGTKGNEESSPPRPVRGGLYHLTIPLTNPLLGTRWDNLFNASLDVNSIFIPASNTKKIYIATSDGMYVSTDGGKNWARQNIGILNSFVRNVAVMNNNSNFLFAGVYGGGILKSTNGGVTWVPSNIGIDNPYLRAVVADPKNAGVLYSASVNGVYKSTDASRTWAKLTFPNSQHDSLSPFNNNSEDGAIRISPVNTNNLLIFALTGEFLSSTDAGVTWTPLVPPQQVTSASVIENIEFDPTNASAFYFSANGIWKTTNLGSTWSSIAGDLPANVTVGGGSYPLFGIHPRIDSSNVNVIYLPTIANGKQYGIYKTTNGGVNWKLLSVKAFDVSIDKAIPSTLFCAGEDGIFQSEDAGGTWLPMVGDGITKYFSISRDPLDPNTVFVGSDIGITRVQYGAALEVAQTLFDFDAQPVGSLSVKNVSFKNVGQKRLTVNFSSLSGSGDFKAIPATLSVDPGASGTIALQYTPKGAGAQQATLTFATNDPRNATVVISVRGTGVTTLSVTRSVLLESTHGISSNLGSSSISQYFSQFVQALQKSGVTVKQDQTAFDPLAAKFDAIIIAAPKALYSSTEIGKLQDYVTSGGLMVMLGDTGKSEANKSLNSILSNFQWTLDPPKIPTGLSLNYYVVYDSTINYLGAPTSPIFTAFVDPTHPFVKGVDSIVTFASSSISTTFQAVPFLKGNSTTFAISSDTSGKITQRPVVAALSQIGKGRILLIGDVDIWSNNNGDPLSPKLTGILAGKNLQFALNVFGYVDNYSVKLPKPTLSEKYQIISVPFDLSNFNIFDVLKDLGSVDPTKWRLYGRWTGTKYLEFPADFLSFKRGEGYWLITKGEQDLTLGTAKISTQQGFYPIALDSGYNLIGNPFPYRVNWATSQLSTPDSVEAWLWNFTGVGFQKETKVMEPFTGYFVKSLRNGVTIYINPTEVTSPGTLGKSAAEQRQFAENEWQIQIRASNGVATDVDNIAGVLRSASDVWDAADFSEPPPAPTDYLALSFNHREWQNNPGRYAGDFRSVHPEGNYWDFDISSAKAEANISIALDKLGNIPSDFEMVLVDMGTERVTDMKSSLSYALTLKKNEYVRSFRLVVGKKEFVEKNTNGIPIVPLAYSLDQNFPNPFNPSTKIRYALGHSSHVELDILNVLGQKVKTLVRDDQRIGSYTMEWDGTNDRNAKVSSGIYFYRIRTEEFSATKKMVLLK
jgi:photosystem II stability/assembly factor-like uncharacterized protein